MHKKFSLILSLLMTAGLFAQNPDWQSITSLNNITDMAESEGRLWVASDGGLFQYDPDDGVKKRFDNLNGLLSVDLTSVTVSPAGEVIVGSSEGFLQLYAPQQDAWQTLYDFDGLAIGKIIASGDSLYVSAGNGVGVFLRRNQEYSFNDYLINFPELFNTLNDMALFNGRLWLATETALFSAKADFTRFNLTDPQNWKVHSERAEFNNGIRAFYAMSGNLWIANANGLFKLDNSGQVTQIDRYRNYSINGLGRRYGRLVIVSGNNYRLYDPADGSEEVFSAPSAINAAQTTEEGLYLGLANAGLYNTEKRVVNTLSGPARNAVRFVLKDTKERLWASSGKYKLTPNLGFFLLENDNWTHYDFGGEGWNNLGNTTFIYEDRFGTVWLGSWGGGLMGLRNNDLEFLHNHDQSGQLILTDTTTTVEALQPVEPQYRGYFSPAPNNILDYLVITAMTEDDFGRLWIVNAYANNGQFIAVAPYNSDGFLELSPSAWTYFGRNDGISLPEDEGLSCIAIDDFGRVWIGTQRDGVYILDYNNTLNDKSDDQVFNLDINDNLYGNSIRSLAYDDDGIMWIGTTAGLNSFDGQNLYRHAGDENGLNGPLSNSISQIVVDRFNNKWIATAGGVSILRGGLSAFEAGSWVGYTSSNSGLLDNNVHSVFVDNDEGAAYIGTESGISVFRGTFAEIRSDFSDVSFGPNPYYVDENVNFTITNLMNNSTVKIFDLNGSLVRELSVDNRSVDGSRAEWDGRDLLGNKVASGIYLFMAFTAEGKAKAGKFAVIR